MHTSQSDSDLSHFLDPDPLPPWSHPTIQDQSLLAPHENQTRNFDDLLQNKTVALTWSEHLNSVSQDQSTALVESQHSLPATTANPWTSHPVPWHHLINYQYSLQGQFNPHHQDHLSSSSLPHLPLLTLPITYPDNSAPQSASYASSSPISYATAPSSPFSFPPSPLPFDPPGCNQIPDTHAQRYVHPSDLSAPVVSPTVPSLTEWNDTGASAVSAGQTRLRTQDNTKDASQIQTYLPAPTTRSRNANGSSASLSLSGSKSDPRNNDRALASSNRSSRRPAVRNRGEKRKHTPPRPLAVGRTRIRNSRSHLANHRSQLQKEKGPNGADNERLGFKSSRPETSDEPGDGKYFNDDQEDENEDLEDSGDYQEDGDDGSFSTSSYSPSSSPSPRPSNANFSAVINSDSKSRTRHGANGLIPLPVPVPNLTKKSRGRKVPSIQTGGTGNSVMDVNADSSDAVDTASLRQRGYMCRVPGCGKCFVRGEHLKRHVRSIHTYEKPHACPHHGCDKTFSRRDNLAQHLRVHR